MKLKGISIFEQHVEKLVLGVFALVLLGVFGYQLLPNPNAVQVGSGPPVSPEQAPERVRELANQVRAKLESPQVPNLPPLPTSDRGLDAVLSGNGPAFDTSPLALAGPHGDSKLSPQVDVVKGTAGGGLKFEMPKLPAPSPAIAELVEGTIDPIEASENTGLAALLPTAAPLDLRAVTVGATLDAKQLVAALHDAPAAPGVNALPTDWWQGRCEILDVELIRQARAADGSWGPDESVPPPPGRASLRQARLAAEPKPADLPLIQEKEKAGREDIRRPRYYPTIAGPAWMPPSKLETDAGKPSFAIGSKLRELQDLAQKLERMRKDLAAPPKPPPPPSGGDGGGGGGGGPPGSGGGGGGQDNSAAEDWIKREERRKKTLQAQIESTQKQYDALIAEMKKAGFDEKGHPIVDPKSAVTVEPLNALTEAPLGTVTLWAHDLAPKHGAEYRYKLRVWVTNPFFGKLASLDDSQKDWAKPLAIACADSEWSSPVVVEPDVRYFLTGGHDANALAQALEAEASSSGELFTFYYGYWRKGNVRLTPGDLVRSTVDLPELTLYTIKLGADGKPDLAAVEKKPADRKKTVSEGSMMLDVVPIGGAAGSTGVGVIMREKDGKVDVRQTAADETDPSRSHLARSAEQGAHAVVSAPGAAPGAGAPPPPAPGGREGPGNPDNQPPGGGKPPKPGKPGGSDPPPSPSGKPE